MKTCESVSYGKPDAGNPHVRFDEGEVAPAKPRRGSLLYKFVVLVLSSVLTAWWASAMSLESAALKVTFGAAEEGYAVTSVENTLAGGVFFVHNDNKPTPRWRVEEFRNCANSFLSAPEAGLSAADFWELELRSKTSFGDRRAAVFVDNRSACAARTCQRHAEGVLFNWRGVKLPAGTLDVTARVTLDADGSTRWTLDVDVQSEQYALFDTRYPVLKHVVRDGEADIVMPRSDLGAKLIRKAPYAKNGLAFGALAYVPMMTAFIVGDAGLYIAAHDDAVNTKSLVITGDRDVTFSAPAPRGPFAVTLAAFKGDWWQAAKRYRAWALTAPWCRKGRILDRKDYPRRMCEMPLWFNFHGKSAAASNVLTRAKQLFPNVSTGLHWHRWQAVPWEIGHYPEYFPEDGGVRECLAYCRAIGQEPMLYTLPRLYSKSLLSFHFAAPFALRNEKGDYVIERYGAKETNPPELVPMCPAVKAWQDCIVDYSHRILDLGGCSIFEDQVASCPAKSCWGAGHGHAPGGGSWFYRSLHDICARVHDDYAARDALTTAEGSSDAFIDVMDGLLTVTPRTTDDLPFWHAVYGGYTTYFGTPENHEDDDDTFWALQAREVLWGQVLGWYHPKLMDDSAKVSLLKRLIAFRQANLDCLAYGALEGEVAFENAVDACRLTLLGRVSFPDWGNPKAKRSATTYGTLPSVLGYVYASGTNGQHVALLANLKNVPQKVAFVWKGSRREIELAPRELLTLNLTRNS